MFVPTVKSRKKRKSNTPIPSESNDEVDNKKQKEKENDEEDTDKNNESTKITNEEEDSEQIEESNDNDENEKKRNEEDAEKQRRSRTLKEIIKQKPTGKPTRAYLEKAAERKNRKNKSETKKEEVTIKDQSTVKSPPPSSSETVPQVTPSFAPQLRIVDGKIEIDQSSLVIPQVTEEVQRDVVHENRTHITSGTYLKKSPSEKWTPEEIETFYKALRQCGTDFSLVERFFPNRSRRQIKNRFKKEEKMNPSKIDEALRNRMPLDVEFLKSTMTEK